jgi:hypothetical protein
MVNLLLFVSVFAGTEEGRRCAVTIPE